MTLEVVPSGRTARRLEWPFLPPHVRALVEERCGSPVVGAESQGGGFTPGFASVLTCADGSRHFVKGAAATAQRAFAAAYRVEASMLAALPAAVPAPPLRWWHDGDWVLLGTEYVAARAPHRPWTAPDLDATLDALEQATDVLTPAPAKMRLRPLGEELAGWPAHWQVVLRRRADLAGAPEAAALAARFADVLAGDSVVHNDVRDDNVLIRGDGSAVLCDWNWPVLGAPWLDTVCALVGPRGDGLDVETVLRDRRLTRDVPDDHVDVALALLAGFLLRHADEQVPASSPWIRAHQAWMGTVAFDWLAERRGWQGRG